MAGHAPAGTAWETKAQAKACPAVRGGEGMREMADPGGSVEVHGAVAVTGEITGRDKDADALLAQIETTRDDLARTIDSLAGRVSPANNVRMLRERAARELNRPEVKKAAAAAGAVIAGLVILRIWSRRRH
jgi:Protein of unknown function (DUF3618)